MIRYDINALGKYDNYIKILEYLGGEEPTEDEVWRVARECKWIPVFENVLYNMVLIEIWSRAGRQYKTSNWAVNREKVVYFVNGADTHLYINDQEVLTLSEFKKSIIKARGDN